MTYQDLLDGLKEAERETAELEAFVAAKIAKDVAEYGPELDTDEEKLHYADWFISDLVEASWKSVEAGDEAAQNGTQNAYETVSDYGLDFDTRVGQFVFAELNHPAE